MGDNMILELIQYIVLGIIQGFTEPIPVSSSGHLLIVKTLIQSDVLNDMNFDIFVNFGSLIAIIIFFWKDIIVLIKDFFLYIKTRKDKYKANFKYCWLIVIGTIPAGIAGFLLKVIIEEYENIFIVGCSLLVTSLFLFIIKDFKGEKESKDLSIKDAFIIGLFQVVALLPGISRSGATIVGAMFMKLKRDVAFKYSFMLYIPISCATMLLGVKDLIEDSPEAKVYIYYVVGMVVAGIVTYISTKWFSKIVSKGKLGIFSLYCLIVGTIIVLSHIILMFI